MTVTERIPFVKQRVELLYFRWLWWTHPFLCSSFLLTHTAVKASSRRHSSFFLQLRGWHKSPATQEHPISNGCNDHSKTVCPHPRRSAGHTIKRRKRERENL